MKAKGGHNVHLAGRPAAGVKVLPDPEKLYLPLFSQRFNFTEIKVKEGEQVEVGQELAIDPANYSVPLLAPHDGTVRLDQAERHIVLDELVPKPGSEESHQPHQIHIPEGADTAEAKRYKLLGFGAWQFFCDAHTGKLPDPLGNPEAIIISTLHLEPYVARGDVQLNKRLHTFTRGLEHLQSLLEYQTIYLALPDIQSDFAKRVRETLRGYAWIKPVQIPMKYPHGTFRLIARRLGLAAGNVWGLGVHGVLAVDRALTLGLPCDVRVISVAGPDAKEPAHVKITPGYPLKDIVGDAAGNSDTRIINGGVLTGGLLTEGQLGIDAECRGLTLLPEHRGRELFGFMRPGFDRSSFSRCFLSRLRPAFKETLSTALQGEERPCVACGMCREVCPAGIRPFMIHKFLYSDGLEDADRERPDLCVDCGLCSYVCPSKIELMREIADGRELIREELGHAEVEQEISEVTE